MSIAPIPGGLPGIGVTPGFGVDPAYGVASALPRTDTVDVTRADGVESFGTMLAAKLDQLGSLHKRTDDLAVKAATGDLQDVHEYTIAAAESGVATQLTVAVRNKAVESFNEIMRMQL